MIKYVSALSILLFSISGLYANSFKQKQTSFIKSLYKERNYFQCIAETRRLIHYHPQISNKKKWDYFITANYFLGKQYHTVLYNMRQLKTIDFANSILLSHTYLKLNMFMHAGSLLSNMMFHKLNTNERQQLFYTSIYYAIYTDNFNLIDLEIKNHKQSFADSATRNRLFNKLSSYKKLPFKSVQLATFLSSIIPGTGQFYSGKYIAGLITIVGITASLFAAHHYRARPAVTGTFIALSGLFYAGNIYGAHNAAKTRNQYIRNRFLKEIFPEYIPDYNAADYCHEVLR